MKVERIDHVHAYTKDLEKAVSVFGPLLGIDFYPIFDASDYGARAAMNPIGLECVEPTDPSGVAARAFSGAREGDLCISLKVPDIEEAIAEMESKGMKLVARMEIGKLKEAAFETSQTCGVLIELCEYPGNDITLAALS